MSPQCFQQLRAAGKAGVPGWMKVLEARPKPPAQQGNGVSNPRRTGAIGARLFTEQHPYDSASPGCLCYSGGMLPEGPGKGLSVQPAKEEEPVTERGGWQT